MYELIDARTHGPEFAGVSRPLIIVERTPWSSKYQYRRVFDFTAGNAATALEVLKALNDRDIAEADLRTDLNAA